jgi:KaiC/GvpD/RAD55 family RecA-like ATPase
MAFAEFTQDQIEQYYRIRLDRAGFHHVKGNEWRSKCILHGGDNPNSLWVDLEKGGFCCFSCNEKGGGIYSFEQILLRHESTSGQAPETGKVTESIHAVLGTPFVSRVYQEDITTKPKGTGWDRKQAQDYYVYQDELGRELYRVWRFVDRDGNKVTPPDHLCRCQSNPDTECEPGCVNGRVWGAKEVRRVLYRLPDIIQSSFCFIVEGEKDVNNLSRALALYISRKKGFKLANLLLDRVGVTTNMGGSSGWKPEYEYGKYFMGKIVVKLGDNDEAGRLHDAAVCKDVSRYAHQLYTLEIPVGEKEDISDYLKDHTIEDLIKLMESGLKKWEVAKAKEVKVGVTNEPRIVLVHPVELTGRESKPTCDWLVEGLIERGQRGLVVAPPKVGKSIMFLDMCVSLASCTRFLGADPYFRPVKSAIISREDGPELVKRRLTQLAAGRGLSLEDVNSNILVNTVKQSSSFHIDSQKELEEMAEWLKAGKVEFCVVDVLNRLHYQNENSTDDMTKVMIKFDELATLSGAQVCVIHHLGRTGNSRGSTTIEGWADFICKLEQDPIDESLKSVTIKTKARGTIEPRSVKYWQSDDKTQSRILLVEKIQKQGNNGNGRVH